MECSLTKYTCPFCRFCLGRWKSAPVSDLPKSHYQYIYSVMCIADVSPAKREAAGSCDLCSEQSDQIRWFDFSQGDELLWLPLESQAAFLEGVRYLIGDCCPQQTPLLCVLGTDFSPSTCWS